MQESERGAMAGSELEYYVFQNGYREAQDKGYAGLRPAGGRSPFKVRRLFATTPTRFR